MSNCCSCSDCCPPTSKRKVQIDFLYLDLDMCTRCVGTDAVLEQALDDVKELLNAAGMEVLVNKYHIKTEQDAVLHRFISSPTIRVNGMDIIDDIKENNCESCGDLCCDTVDCRVWTYEGLEYTVPPKELIVDSILKTVYSRKKAANKETPFILPDNLKRFFNMVEKKI